MANASKTYKFKRLPLSIKFHYTEKMHFNEETRLRARTHDMMLIGKDDAFWCRDDRNRMVIYRDHAHKDGQNELFGHEIWNHFDKPKVKRLQRRCPSSMQIIYLGLRCIKWCTDSTSIRVNFPTSHLLLVRIPV